MEFTIHRFNSIESTNAEATRQAKRGADEGLCVVAKEQTAGKGRLGRTWVSEMDSGIYFSIVTRPKVEMRLLPLLTMMSAIVIFDILREDFRLQPDIKWANDVHINDKKISGILAETVETKTGLAVIVGIGINLNSSNFPPELKETATSIEEETGQNVNYESLLKSLTRKFGEMYEVFVAKNGAEEIRNKWTRRSSYCSGKDVRVILEGKTIFGITCGIEENGALRIRQNDGEIKIIQAGDVERLRQVAV